MEFNLEICLEDKMNLPREYKIRSPREHKKHTSRIKLQVPNAPRKKPNPNPIYVYSNSTVNRNLNKQF